MHASELSEAVIVDVVYSLFDPEGDGLVSDSARALVSAGMEVDFPLLPPKHHSATPWADAPTSHSHSAQALALFHLPSVLVNHVPGASWTLEVTSAFAEAVDAPAAAAGGPCAQWRCTLEWTLRAGVRLPLFGAWDVSKTTTREVVLQFAEKRADDDEERRREREARVTSIDIEDEEESPVASVIVPHSIEATGSSSIFADGQGFGELMVEPEIVLSRIRYSGFRMPERVQHLVGYQTVAKIGPHALELCLSPAYGALHLLGLDASTSPGAPAAEASRKHKGKASLGRSESRKRKTNKAGISNKTKSHRTRDAPHQLERTSGGSSSSASPDSELSLELTESDSRLERTLKVLYVRVTQLREMKVYLAAGPLRAGAEMQDLFAAIRRVVHWLVELVLGFLGVETRWVHLDGERLGKPRRLAEVDTAEERGERKKIKQSAVFDHDSHRSSVSTSPKHTHVKRVSFASSPSRSLPSSPSRSSFGTIADSRPHEYESPERKSVRDFFSPAAVQPVHKQRTPSQMSAASASISLTEEPGTLEAGQTPPRARIHHKKSSQVLSSLFKNEAEPGTPSAEVKAGLNSALDELADRKRQASLVGQDVELHCLIPHQTSGLTPQPSDEVQKHKREVSGSLHDLRLAGPPLSPTEDSARTLLPSSIKQPVNEMAVPERVVQVLEKEVKGEQVLIEDVEDDEADVAESATEADVDADEADADAVGPPIFVEPVPLEERPSESFQAPALVGHSSQASASSRESALDVPAVAAHAAGNTGRDLGTGAQSQAYGLVNDTLPVIPPFEHLHSHSPLGLQSPEAEAEDASIATAAEARAEHGPAQEIEHGIQSIMSPTLSASRAAQFEELLRSQGIASPSLDSAGGVSVTSAPAPPPDPQQGPASLALPAGYVPPKKWWEDPSQEAGRASSQSMLRESSGSSWSSQGYNSPRPDLHRSWSAGTQAALAGSQSQAQSVPNEQGGAKVGSLSSAASSVIDQQAALERDLEQVADPAVADLFRPTAKEPAAVAGQTDPQHELGLDIRNVDFAQPHEHPSVGPKSGSEVDDEDLTEAGLSTDERSAVISGCAALNEHPTGEHDGTRTSFLPFNVGPEHGTPGRAPANLPAQEEDEPDDLPPLEPAADEAELSPTVSEATLAQTNTPGTTPASSPQQSSKQLLRSPAKSKGNRKGKTKLAPLSSPVSSPKTSPKMGHPRELSSASAVSEANVASAVSAASSATVGGAQEQRSPPKNRGKHKAGKKKAKK